MKRISQLSKSINEQAKNKGVLSQSIKQLITSSMSPIMLHRPKLKDSIRKEHQLPVDKKIDYAHEK